MTTFRAKFVAPMDLPIIRDGAVVVENDRIVAVGPIHDFSGPMRDLGEVVLMPGLVNAHTHLELSLCKCEPRAGASFTDWLNNVRKGTPFDTGDAVREGLAQCNRFGITTVGDITQQIDLTRETIRSISDRPTIVSFGEALGLAKRRARFEELFGRAIDRTFESPTLRIGLSPHAPYTVDKPGYEQCLSIAREQHLPLATHLAENPDEREFLEHHAGPFRELWNSIGSWDDSVKKFRGSPIEFANSIGLLDYPTLLAHVNYCDDDEMKLLAAGNASVVYCPRTHNYFDHPPHRWREMLARGINVALGTDSCASSPDLNIVDEIRLLHEIAPEFPIQQLWQMITLHGARALQLQNEVGSITPGKRADLIWFEVRSDDPLKEVLETNPLLPHRAT